MNYRHAFHAGNHCDVVKHLLLTRLIERLKAKEKPFRVFDTHAGVGRYRLASEEAQRSGEAAGGVGRLLEARESWADDPLFAAYRDAVMGDLEAGLYPGSPLLVRRLLRPGDRLSAYELHPDDAQALKSTFAGDLAVKAIELDGWLALGAHLPPKEKRGLVFIDPPFEKASENRDIVEALKRALSRWRNGAYAVWYPIKEPERAADLVEALADLAPGDSLGAELTVEAPTHPARLVGSGLFVLNPPYLFREEAEAILAKLLPLLRRGEGATARIFDGQQPG